jgi:hypothetical protein
MSGPLAVIIDDATFNWIMGSLVVAVPAFGAAIWRLWSQFIAFIKPMIVTIYDKIIGGIDEHRSLVVAMEKNVPVVSSTMAKISETMGQLAESQETQNKVVEVIGKRQVEHGEQIQTIIQHLRVGNG